MALSDLNKNMDLILAKKYFDDAMDAYNSALLVLNSCHERLIACPGFDDNASDDDKAFVLLASQKASSALDDLTAVSASRSWLSEEGIRAAAAKVAKDAFDAEQAQIAADAKAAADAKVEADLQARLAQEAADDLTKGVQANADVFSAPQ